MPANSENELPVNFLLSRYPTHIV